MSKIKTYTYVTGDLTDKTSWFADSAQRTTYTLSDSGDGLTFTSGDANWIDKSKVTMRGDLGTALDVKIYVDATLQTTGYTVDYVNGTVTFDSSQSGSTITATYKYAQTSNHLIFPASGKFYRLPKITAQFTKGASFSSGFQFKVWINNSQSGNTDYCVGTVQYVHVRDILARASQIQSCPYFGGGSSEIIQATWDFARDGDGKDFAYKLFPVGTVVNPELREFNKISIEMINDEVVTGSDFCSATFYFEEDSF